VREGELRFEPSALRHSENIQSAAGRLFYNPSTKQIYFFIHSLTSQDFLEQLFMTYAPAKMQGKSEIKSAYGQHSFFWVYLFIGIQLWIYGTSRQGVKRHGCVVSGERIRLEKFENIEARHLDRAQAHMTQAKQQTAEY
jgi:hypothetical protein